MTEKDVEFFQGIAEQILLYCSKARVNNNEINRVIDLNRAAFKLYSSGGSSSGTVAPMHDANVTLQLNSHNEKVVNSNLLKGEKEELIKLKHGSGSIRIKTRIGKKGELYKIYEGRYYDEYGRYRSVYGKTQSECIKNLKEAQRYKKKGEKVKSLTVEEWMKTWYNEFKKNNIRLSTQRNYENQMYHHILPKLGKKKLGDLTGEELQKFINGIDGGNVRKKTFEMLNACFNKAVVLKKMISNPCAAVVVTKYKKTKRRAFTYDEQNKIFSSDRTKLVSAIFFLCATGLRVGEFLALRKEDFFFEDNFFKVDKAVSAGEIGETKTESSHRQVYYTNELFKYFDLDLLGTYTYTGMRLSLNRLCKSLGIAGVSLHSTRHTFASICHSFGMNDKVLQSLLGHSTLAMTQDTYTHLLKKGTSNLYLYLQDFCAFIRTRY